LFHGVRCWDIGIDGNMGVKGWFGTDFEPLDRVYQLLVFIKLLILDKFLPHGNGKPLRLENITAACTNEPKADLF